MIQVDVTIMAQSYKLSCREGEDRALREAAAFLDAKMTALRDSSKVKGTDRIAVMAALGMTTELLATKSPEGPLSGMSMSEVKQKMEHMHVLMDQALNAQEKLF
ncbi:MULTISPECIES: cell division protein ZapA [unclassified Undibacterium]|uniref:cell division protein ZapA n=1 Tax=unclassified Undibacterium TaxID=2630295 RepID=UPI002AC9ADBA|nr:MULTISPECIES: cell division protein ZapA [unclassified Undibacterium]MEB0137629.1 cell division protein ZapA [Undibacterium sp. CCC2.1]MEB0170630.1 cell division protein ZapA [Undibacterium sp. CCC1.1]MEB0174571.1 cell division protein ZapA [Undibacterium sp. CCC3.4]MEB0213632.1 cell division protein ZapA [Undibacterium sp. 5I2]WPX45565.1 cell division protein ZapA [Undibacterium sp. CCC3.4]